MKIILSLSRRIWSLLNFIAIPQIPIQASICIHRAPLHAKEMLMERCVLYERCELAPPDERERHLECGWTWATRWRMIFWPLVFLAELPAELPMEVPSFWVARGRVGGLLFFFFKVNCWKRTRNLFCIYHVYHKWLFRRLICAHATMSDPPPWLRGFWPK